MAAGQYLDETSIGMAGSHLSIKHVAEIEKGRGALHILPESRAIVGKHYVLVPSNGVNDRSGRVGLFEQSDRHFGVELEAPGAAARVLGERAVQGRLEALARPFARAKKCGYGARVMRGLAAAAACPTLSTGAPSNGLQPWPEITETPWAKRSSARLTRNYNPCAVRCTHNSSRLICH